MGFEVARGCGWRGRATTLGVGEGGSGSFFVWIDSVSSPMVRTISFSIIVSRYLLLVFV